MIGCKKYIISGCYLWKYPQWNRNLTWNPYITLPDVDEDIGHTLVHFLYTGIYETLGSAPDPDISCTAREFRKSALVYHIARTYNLPELETLAKKYIEHFEESISIFNILQAKSCIEAGAEDLPADRYLDKMSPAEEHVTEAYPVKDTAAEVYLIEECAIEEPSTEAYPVEEPAEEEPAPEEPLFEDCPVEDPLAEDPPQEEPLTEAYPIEEPLVEECPIGEPPAETYATDQHPAEEPPLEEHPDVSLYANWKKLSPKKRLKRRKILQKKGLPIPN
ncbi:hypothetical protein BDDG_09608 [Blastomyces dermatitidis ATCC 18188]|uniref:BTB domain-containing protein n=2 Tax=Ajellomyces dermatitidis TaxID=5039 RepID=F2TTU8_AJEDA|nr:hypothetical protein BDDG_09608 [Blastomyces dermatitidis ATCC 18188]